MPPEFRPPDGAPFATDPDSEAPPEFVYARPWMAEFVADALRTADVPGALSRAEVGWGDYARFRRECPAFGAACEEIDLVVKQALVLRLEAMAAAGDTKATKLLCGGLDLIRAQLADAGIGAGGPHDPRDDVPLVKLGGYALPVGPCAACARGLLVFDQHELTGQRQWVLVRHAFLEPSRTRADEAAEWSQILPYPSYDHDGADVPGIRVVYAQEPEGDPLPMEKPLHVARHDNDWGIHPRHCLPAHTGPNRAELERRWERQRAALPRPAGSAAEPDRRTPEFLPMDLKPGESPAADVADFYHLVYSPHFQATIYRLKPRPEPTNGG